MITARTIGHSTLTTRPIPYLNIKTTELFSELHCTVPMSTPSLSIITTTDPLAGQLPTLLKELSALASSQAKLFEVVVVDDLAQWKKSPPPEENAFSSLHIKTICPSKRTGQINAIHSGLQQTTAPYLLTIDPDMHSCVPEIPTMLGMLDDNTLAVHGVRSARPDANILRLMGSALANKMVQKTTGLCVEDIGSPVSLFDRKVLSMIPQQHQNANIKLLGYLILGSRLGSYRLQGRAAENTASHYKLAGLAQQLLRLFNDCLYTRRQFKRSASIPQKQP